MTSFAWSTSGILSAKNSIVNKIASAPKTQSFAKRSNGADNLIQSVKRAVKPTISSGIYAFKPLAADRPNAERIEVIVPIRVLQSSYFFLTRYFRYQLEITG